jgi:putative spermidine/putrescine transport system permease protein
MLGLVSLLILSLLVLPVLILVPVALSSVGYLAFPPPALSLRWFQQILTDARWLDSFLYSFRIAVWVSLISMLLGLAAAMGLARGRLRAPLTLFSILLSPLIVPTIITSIGLYFVFARLHLVGSEWAIVIGQSVLEVPITTILLTTSLRGLDPALDQAAEIHGASPGRTLRHVTLPLIAPGLFAAALFAFLGSFDELLIALFVAGPVRQTLPVRMWNTIQFELDPSVAAVSVIVTIVAVLVLTVAGQLQAYGRGSGAT